MRAKYNGKCTICSKAIHKGDNIQWNREEGARHSSCVQLQLNLEDSEYSRGYNDTRQAQMAGPAGSAAREAAYMDMELQWAREGFDG